MKGLLSTLVVGLAAAAGPALGFTLAPAAPGGAETLTLDSAVVLAQAQTGHVTLPLSDGPVSFELRPRPIAEAAVWGLDGVPMGRVTETVTFAGTADGVPARLAATEAGLFIAVLSPDPWFVLPLWLDEPGAAPTLHRLLRWSENPPVIPAHPDPASPFGAPPPPLTAGPPPANRVVDLLIEEDNVMWQRTSALGTCDECWVQVQQAILNVVEQLFEPQTGVSFRITSQWACKTVSACPYQGVESDDWLQAFMDRWEAKADEPAHHLGHLLVGINLLGVTGSAMTGVVATPRGYALSEFAANVSPFTNSPFHNFFVTAHEIGHNFNGVHDEADPIPPSLSPAGATGVFWTIMAPGEKLYYQFSDGNWDPSHNNVGRIVTHAVQQLPP